MAPNEQLQNQIIRALERAGINAMCSRCNSLEGWTVLDAYFNIPAQTDLHTFQIGGPSVPMVAVACKRCGFVSFHAAKALGLLSE